MAFKIKFKEKHRKSKMQVLQGILKVRNYMLKLREQNNYCKRLERVRQLSMVMGRPIKLLGFCTCAVEVIAYDLSTSKLITTAKAGKYIVISEDDLGRGSTPWLHYNRNGKQNFCHAIRKI